MVHPLLIISVAGLWFGGGSAPASSLLPFPLVSSLSFHVCPASHKWNSPPAASLSPLLGTEALGDPRIWLISLLPSISSCYFASLLTNFFFSYFQTTRHHNITKPFCAVFLLLTFASPSPLRRSFLLELSPSQLSPVLSKLQHGLPFVFGAISFTLFLSQSTLLPPFWGTCVFLL